MKAMSLRISMQTLSPGVIAERMQARGDAVGARGDLVVAAAAVAADDAVEERGHCRLSDSRVGFCQTLMVRSLRSSVSNA